jgi:hypothetical protein
LLKNLPTPVDKLSVLKFSEILSDEILETAREITTLHKDKYINDNFVLLESKFAYFDIKTKTEIKFPIIVRSIVHSLEIDRGNLILGSDVDDIEEKITIEIVINGAYTWQKLKELRLNLINELNRVLLTELMHAIQIFFERKDLTFYTIDKKNCEDVDFINSPDVVQNLLDEILEEALVRAESFSRQNLKINFTRDQVLDYVYNGEIWKQSVHHMNERNHAKMIKIVLSALVDAGWL